jgi:tRNA(Ile)-lysidine synthase
VSEPDLGAWSARLVAIDDLAPGAPVVVGCSGGADSLALLTLACARGYRAEAVYVDHGLHPGTQHDSAVVARAAARLGAAMRVVSVDVDARANVEARARDARYRALEEVRAELGAAAILVAHTRDDQAETVLLNLMRGSGTSGLAGMPARRGHLRRPLLGLRRRDTAEICAWFGFAPVRDPMNDDLRYRRVWLRREVLPRLSAGAQRDLVEVLARQADLVREDDEFLDALAAEHNFADARALASLPRALARRVVRRALGSPPVDGAAVERVLAVARGERRAAELPGGGRVERVSGKLTRIVPTGTTATPVRLALPGRAEFAGFEVNAWIEEVPPVAWPDGRYVAVCDAEAVGSEVATVRAPWEGERFRPLGRSGTKLLADALAEAGVSATARATAPIVATTDLIWVVGYRIDHRVRVRPRTRRFLWLSAEQHA